MTLESIRKRAREAWAEFNGGERPQVLVGAGTCGRAAGAEDILQILDDELPVIAPDAAVHEVGCLGLCYAEPLVELRAPGRPRVLFGDVTLGEVPDLLRDYFGGAELSSDRALAVMDGPAAGGIPAFEDLPMLRNQVRIVLRNAGRIEPDSIEHYVACGGYEGLGEALEMSPDDVIGRVKDSGLRGRGGAGFPTGVKWEFCRRADGEQKYMICNADEGDPGAFMDRSVIESDPYALVEGITIAAYAIGASEGYIYVRAEYPLAIERLEAAIARAEECGLLGEEVMGSDFSFHLKLKKGAGAFVCGEETALLASIEGRRGMPRSRPPFPAQEGLHGKPTNINNVETLANVPAILRRGSEWFRQYGTERSPGTKTFALAGKINRTGLIEVPLGLPLQQIVFDIGGGIPDDKQLKAVQTGGPSGGCIPAHLMDTPADYERLTELGSIMGSGGMVVMDEDTCMVDVARYFVDFLCDESCGKCVPCRLGTRQMLRILNATTEGGGNEEDIERLRQIGQAVKQGSLCGLGQTAPNPVLSTLRYFPEEYEAHIRDRRCPAGVCLPLIQFTIDPEACICCGRCASTCPVDCISGKKGKPPARCEADDPKAGEPFVIDQNICIKCGACHEVCPVGAVEKE